MGLDATGPKQGKWRGWMSLRSGRLGHGPRSGVTQRRWRSERNRAPLPSQAPGMGSLVVAPSQVGAQPAGQYEVGVTAVV